MLMQFTYFVDCPHLKELCFSAIMAFTAILNLLQTFVHFVNSCPMVMDKRELVIVCVDWTEIGHVLVERQTPKYHCLTQLSSVTCRSVTLLVCTHSNASRLCRQNTVLQCFIDFWGVTFLTCICCINRV
jgi:hypothetical protein